jgi:uncharacterized membrane protein
MADANMVLYTAVYDTVGDALSDLDALEELHDDQVLGKYDAAVVDREDGKPHIVKRVDRPRVRVVPELLGGGTLPSKDLKDAADELTGSDAMLVVAGEPTLEKGFDNAVKNASKVVKRSLDSTTEQIARQLQDALKE